MSGMAEVSNGSSAQSDAPQEKDSTGESSSDVGGILCNDPSGLLLGSRGSLHVESANDSGTYTNLVKLAAKLKDPSGQSSVSPLITIETEDSAILVKEYDGHAVAMRVPRGTDSPES